MTKEEYDAIISKIWLGKISEVPLKDLEELIKRQWTELDGFIHGSI
jgi:hypothetical protein